MEFIHNYAPLIGFCLNMLLIFLVLRQHLHSRTHQVFSLFLLAMGAWAFTTHAMRMSPTLEGALPWEKAILAILPFMAVAFYHFVLLITKRKVRFMPPWLAYLIAIGFLALWPTDLLVSGMKVMWYGNGLIYGPLLPIYSAIFYGFVIFALLLLIRAYYTHNTPLERTRYVYIGLGAGLCLIGLLIDILAARGVPIYPMGIISNILFSLICTYAILKYHLLDVRFVIRKGSAYFLISTISLAILIAILVLAYFFITETWTLPLWLNILVVLFISLGIQPHIKWAQKTVDKMFYRDRYDYLKALDTLGAEMKVLTDLSYIAESLANTVAAAMKCKGVAVLLPDAGEQHFITVAYIGQKNYGSVKLKVMSAIPWQLKETGEIIESTDFDISPQLNALTEKERALLANLEAQLLIPLMTRESLKGILVLGPKISGQEYSVEEVSLLRVVSRQMSTILDNARLYELQSKRYEEQTLLTKLGLIVSSELNIKKLCSQFIGELRQVVPIDYASMFVSDESSYMKLACVWTKLPEFSEREHNLANNVSEVLTYLLSLPQSDEESLKKIGQELLYKEPLFKKAGIRSLTLLPLQSKERTTGFIIFATRKAHGYDENSQRLLKQVAIQLAIARDNTRLYELERKANKELELQYKERTDFVNSLIHEIKTPLTAMIASTELLKYQLADDTTPVGALVENLDVSANNLNTRISELVDFVRLQNTQLTLNLKTLDINELVHLAAAQVMGLLNSKQQSLQIDLPESLDKIKGDPDRIMQILLNLLTNASKFSGPNETLVMKTYSDNGNAVVELLDAAPPIAMSRIEKIFDPHRQNKGGSRGGLGLGLSICKHLVELHGGKIWVEPDAKGNRFKFSLPLSRRMSKATV